MRPRALLIATMLFGLPNGQAYAQQCLAFTPPIVPFRAISYISLPNAAGDRLVVGTMDLAALSVFPLSNEPNQKFCNLLELAVGFVAEAYVPTAAEFSGDFSAFAGLLIDPITGLPFPGGRIPASRLGSPHAWRISSTSPSGGTPGTPSNVVAVPSGGVLNVSWSAPGGSPAPSYSLDFRSGGTFVATVRTGAATSVSIAVPPGIVGTFTVTVTALSGSTAGSPSAPATFTIGGGGCTSAPPTPTGVSGGVVNGTATARWNASPGASSYIVQAGEALGGSEMFNGNVGSATAVSAGGLPAGFRAFVRIIAVNACGQSAPTADFLVQ